MSPGESGDVVSDTLIDNETQTHRGSSNLKICTPEIVGSNSCLEGVFVYSVNIQSLVAHLPELICQLQVHRPHILLIQETWLDKSVEDVEIADYNLVSRRDRHDNANRGGIVTYQRVDFNGLVHIENSPGEERN